MALQLRGRLGYGVATNVYGSGLLVGDSFDYLADAEEFAGRKMLGGAVVCRFSDGRWRPILDQSHLDRLEALRQKRIDRVVRRGTKAVSAP